MHNFLPAETQPLAVDLCFLPAVVSLGVARIDAARQDVVLAVLRQNYLRGAVDTRKLCYEQFGSMRMIGKDFLSGLIAAIIESCVNGKDP